MENKKGFFESEAARLKEKEFEVEVEINSLSRKLQNYRKMRREIEEALYCAKSSAPSVSYCFISSRKESEQ